MLAYTKKRKKNSSIVSVHNAKHNFYLVHSDQNINQMTAMVNGPKTCEKNAVTFLYAYIAHDCRYAYFMFYVR